MKIYLIVFILFVLLIINPIVLFVIWLITSPVMSNYMTRPWDNPFFGSYRLVDLYVGTAGFSFEELINYDRIALSLLFLWALSSTGSKGTKYPKIDTSFLIFLGAIGLSTLSSNNFFQAVRYLIDTFGLCYFAYYLGKNKLFENRQFNISLNAIVILGCVLVAISLTEYIIHSNVFMYRITGPFRYWETLSLILAIVFFITLFKKNTSESNKKIIKISYVILLILLGITIFLAQTRTTMFTVLLALIFMSIKGKEIINKEKLKKYYSYGVVLIIVVSAFPALLTSTSFYQHRLTSRTDEGRIEPYIVATRMFMKHPVLGIGLKDFGDDKFDYVTTRELNDPDFYFTMHSSCHNSYLVTAAETGIIGLLPLVILAVFSYNLCGKYYMIAEDRNEKLWALTMNAIVIVYYMTALLFDPFYETTIENKIFYLCLGITVGRYNRLASKL